MAGDSRVLMDHNMEIGVTPAQVSCETVNRTKTERRQRGSLTMAEDVGRAGDGDDEQKEINVCEEKTARWFSRMVGMRRIKSC